MGQRVIPASRSRKVERMRWTAAFLGSALACVIASAVPAQEEPYPTRAVRLIAAAGPGGNPDVLARLLAQKLSDAMGKPFVVENVPGAGGVVAANQVAKAAPDGYVLMLGDSGALAINAALNPNLSYHPVRDFTPITALATVPTVLLVNPGVPAGTLSAFLALAKAKPDQMSYGSAGPGSIHHLTMAIFAERAGIALQHVPYRGGSAMVNGLLTGEIQAGWSGIPNVIPLIDSGKLRAYCVSILERSQSLPAVPTCAELGFAGFDIATMIGLQAPAGAPPGVVARLQAECAKAMRDPGMVERMTQLGMVVQESGTAHYQRFMLDDLERYAVAVRQLGLEIK
jgi:tripartite-type tricarboxylate transporter receptor subunit TctC